MARRQSNAQQKAESAKKLAEPDLPDEDEQAADGLEDFDGPTVAEGKNADADLAPAAGAPRGIFDPNHRREPAPRPVPNKPSFDWIRNEDGSFDPNLQAGEEVTGGGERGGVNYVRTSRGRFIYLCTAADYQKKVSALPSLELYREAFPQAFK